MSRILRLTSRYGRWAMAAAYLLILIFVALWMRWVEFGRPNDDDVGLPDNTRSNGLPLSDAQTTTDFLLSALLLAVSTGALAAALVEVFKRLSSARGSFQLFELREYLREASRHIEQDSSANEPPTSAGEGAADVSAASTDVFQQAWGQLERAFGEIWLTDRGKTSARRLARGYPRRDARYFFDLPLEQLMAQLGGALQVAIGDASNNRELLACFAGHSHQDLVRTASPPNADKLAGPEQDRVVQARTLLSERVTRGLDAVQIIIGHRWRWFVRTLAAGVCALIGVVAVELTNADAATSLLLWLVAAVPGTYFSWFTRDVTSVIERLR